MSLLRSSIRPARPRRVGLATGLLAAAVCCAPAIAAPPLDEALGPETIMPPAAARVPFTALPPLPAADADFDPAQIASDPELFARFIEANPRRLDVSLMEPALALTLAQVLLRGDRTFLAERLLHAASAKWPERVDIVRGHGRVLISLGRPEAALRSLQPAVQRSPGDPALRYLIARALLSLPRSAANEQAAIQALEAVIEIDPTYRDPEGVGAADIRQVIQRMRAAPGGGR